MAVETVVTYEMLTALDEDQIAAIDALQRLAMGTLAAQSPWDQIYTLSEFAQLVGSDEVYKLLAHDADRLIAAAMLTRDLDLVPGLSVDFFESRYPVEIAAKTAWYLIMVVIDPEYWHGDILDQLGSRYRDFINSMGATIGFFDVTAARHTMMRSWLERICRAGGLVGDTTVLETHTWGAVDLTPAGAATDMEIDLR